MKRRELNKHAIELFKKEFELNGFIIGDSTRPIGEVNFVANSSNGRTIKIKVRSISQIGGYIFVEKVKFDVEDTELYMAVAYIPSNEEEKILYLIPAIEWTKSIYPFKGKDYQKEGQVSLPEWGIAYSQKAKDAMEPYRFYKVIDSLT